MFFTNLDQMFGQLCCKQTITGDAFLFAGPGKCISFLNVYLRNLINTKEIKFNSQMYCM